MLSSALLAFPAYGKARYVVVAASPLPVLTVQRKDLRAGYKMTEQRFTAADTTVGGYHIPARAYRPMNARSTYTVALRLSGFPDFRVVDNTISVYATVQQAQRAYAANNEQIAHWSTPGWNGTTYGNTDRWVAVANVGFGQAGTEWTIGIQRPDYLYRIAMVLLQRGRYLTSIRVFAFTFDPRASAAQLAHLIDRRIQTHG
jgi:hypothetical protein